MEANLGFESKRQPWVLLGGVLIALFGLDVLDVVLPSPDGLSGPLIWLRLIAPHWLLTVSIIAGIIWIERRPLASIGLTRPTTHDLGLGVLGFGLGVLAFGLTRPIVRELGLTSSSRGIELIGSLPPWVAVTLALTAGITEEVLFRGYPIERLTELTGRLSVGAAVTFLVFTLAHVPFWGLGGALQIGAWTLVVTVLYVRTRNLPACMLMHIANDIVAFVVLPLVFENAPTA